MVSLNQAMSNGHRHNVSRFVAELILKFYIRISGLQQQKSDGIHRRCIVQIIYGN